MINVDDHDKTLRWHSERVKTNHEYSEPSSQFISLRMLSIGLFVTSTQSSVCLPFLWRFSAHHRETFFKSSNWAPEPSLFWMLILDNLPTILQWLNSTDDTGLYTNLMVFIERILSAFNDVCGQVPSWSSSGQFIQWCSERKLPLYGVKSCSINWCIFIT